MKIRFLLNYIKKKIVLYSHSKSIFLKYIGDIVLNVFVIVFSVYLAQYIDRKREEETKQADVKEFLLGLKTDLENDIREMKEDKKSYIKYGLSFIRFTSKTPIAPDSIYFYLNSIYSATGLVVNNGRYEGFKTTGKMLDIKDKELLNNILDLYQENIPTLVSSTNSYNSQKGMLVELIYTHQDRRTKDNIAEVILLPKFYNICSGLRYVAEIQGRYDDTINLSKKIVDRINKIYAL
jgi:hypothetical protein